MKAKINYTDRDDIMAQLRARAAEDQKAAEALEFFANGRWAYVYPRADLLAARVSSAAIRAAIATGAIESVRLRGQTAYQVALAD